MAADDVQRSTAASRAANDQGDSNRSQGNVKTSRRRTKTGCLTCRKRRIKCDEGRPTCNNCFKSKRQCEGYQPSPMRFQVTGNEYSQHLMTMPYQPHMSDAKQPGNHSHILPRPPPPGQYQSDPDPASESQWTDSSMYMRETDLDQPDMVSIMMAANQASPSAMTYIHQFPSMVQNVRAVQPTLMNGTNPAIDNSSGGFVSGQPFLKGAHEHYSLQNLNGSMNTTDLAQFAVPNPVSPEGFVWNPNIHAYDQRLYTSIPPEQFDYTESFAEEEMYDVGSDDEGFNGMPERTEPMGLPLIMAAHSNFDVRALRTHDTFLNTPNILVHYEPQWLASPLSDPTTARIFTHFIAVTACHLSLGQRRASNPSLLFQPTVPKSQQGLWTYILPQKALTNQGLMHAMLALASLQIAMLQGTDRHTARKHYHFAIRRNSSAVGSQKKRTSIATIATTLLLGCFEVWAADHSNWNSHLIGARQLLLEAEFVKQSKQIKEQRYQAAPLASPDDPYALYLQQKAGPVLQADLPDEDFLERITGFALPYSDRGVKTQEEEEASPPLSQHQIDHYDTYADLFWFYLKQDIYYSTISSNPLLLPYSRWADCPPRAPMGKLDAIYGTSDHLILIYGRIAKFISEDLVRKKKAVEANGGHWRPRPGMFPGAAAGRMPGVHAKGKPPGGGGGAGAPSPQGPSFMGMIPAPPTPRMPSAFKENNQGTPYMPAPKAEQDVGDLDVAFERALIEWDEIRAVLKEFKAALQAVEWQALPIHAARPIATHFGSALQYGDYRIADIWSMFYTAKIILARVHPAMPPAAMMAAAVCAQQTAKWANTIGKIVFGMQTPASDEPLNPTFASVLTQNMYCLFFAGVQYSEPAQRLICVDRLRYIAEKVGHESSALIAAALETCWINAFRMGRGPEWQRTLGLAVDTGDENRKTEFRTMERKKDGATVYIRNDELRTQFGMGIMGLESDFTRLKIIDNYGFNVASSGKL